MTTISVTVQITRFVDSTFPGWVACTLKDASGREWEFIDKVPIFTPEDLNEHSLYPRSCVILCELLHTRLDGRGRTLHTINTSQPLGLESVGDETQFEVALDGGST